MLTSETLCCKMTISKRLGSGIKDMHFLNDNKPKRKKIKTFPDKNECYLTMLMFLWNTEFLHNFLLLTKFKFRNSFVKFLQVWLKQLTGCIHHYQFYQLIIIWKNEPFTDDQDRGVTDDEDVEHQEDMRGAWRRRNIQRHNNLGRYYCPGKVVEVNNVPDNMCKKLQTTAEIYIIYWYGENNYSAI